MGIKVDYRSFTKKRRKLVNGFPVGMVLFTGGQGSGKSLNQSRYIFQLQNKYGAKVYSATDYKHADEVIDEDDIANRIMTKREDKPTIFALDEIQVLLDRENMKGEKSTNIRKAIQQQRKRNTSIIGTVQVLLDLETIYRRQIAYVVNCSHIGPIQIETWIDGSTLKFDDAELKYKGDVVDVKIWKRHNEMYDLYDTYEIVGGGDAQKKKQYQKGETIK